MGFTSEGLKSKETGFVLGLLRHEESAVRSLAARELHFRAGRMVFDALKPLCSDACEEIRDTAALTLGQLGTPAMPFRDETVPLLLKLMKDPAPLVRSSAACALGHLFGVDADMSPEVERALHDLARDRSCAVRSGVAFALMSSSGSSEVLSVLNELFEDEDEDVADWAAMGLELFDTADDHENFRRERIAADERTKAKMSWNERLNHDNAYIRYIFAQFLGESRYKKRAAAYLARLLKDRFTDVRSCALDSLRCVGSEKYINDVIPFLDDKEAEVRISATEFLCDFGGEAEARVLLKYLNDKSPRVRAFVAGTIGEIGSGHEKALEARLKIENRDEAKVGILEGLYHMGQKERLAELCELLKADYDDTRAAAAFTLAFFADKENYSLIHDSLLKAQEMEGDWRIREALKRIEHLRN